jgi:ribosome-associated protein
MDVVSSDMTTQNQAVKFPPVDATTSSVHSAAHAMAHSAVDLCLSTPAQAADSHGGELPSRSEMKRRMDRLQDLGRLLVELTPGKLAKIELPEKLRAHVVEAQRLTAMGAIRRQIQYIGRIMDEFDTPAIARALRDIDQVPWIKPVVVKTPRVLAAEELIEGGDEVLFTKYSGRVDAADLQRIRQAVRLAKKNIASGKAAAHEVVVLASKLKNS